MTKGNRTKGKISLEILFHFQCGACGKWWSIGDAMTKGSSGGWYCPWCGIENEIDWSEELANERKDMQVRR